MVHGVPMDNLVHKNNTGWNMTFGQWSLWFSDCLVELEQTYLFFSIKLHAINLQCYIRKTKTEIKKETKQSGQD